MSDVQNKIKFEVISQSKLMDQVGDIMSKLDLGLSGISAPVAEIWSWNTPAKIDLKYINKMKRAVKGALEANNMRLIKVRKIK